MSATPARAASEAPSSAELRQQHAAHVARLQRAYEGILSSAGLDAVVIHSGSLKSRSSFDDQYWSLRATPHFQHWLPLAEANCALVIRSGARPLLVWLKEQN